VNLVVAMKKQRRNTVFIKQFGDQIRKIRLQKEMSQEDLAYKSELHLSTVGRIERGEENIGLTMIKLLADNLEVPPKELFNF